MRAGRNVRRLLIVALGAAALGGCETASNTGGVSRDNVAPHLTLTTAADSQNVASGLTFNVSATDNVALDSVDLTFSVGYVATKDTGFTGTVQSASYAVTITAAQLAGAGGQILIVGTARDGAGNRSRPDTLSIFLANNQALAVSLLAPTPGAQAGPNTFIPITVKE